MKNSNALSMVMLAFSSVVALQSFAFAGDFPAPELVSVASDDLFAPPGFDSNDNAQLVMHGQLVSTCYRAASPDVTVDKEKRLITVQRQAYFYPGCWCLEMMVPFTQTIDLGVLPAGKYRVVENDNKGAVLQATTLSVEGTDTPSPDEWLYAAVKTARVETAGAKNSLILNGTLNDDCMEIQEAKVLHRSEHIIEVLPIAAYKQGSTCQNNPRPFELKVNLPQVKPGNTLIHVRSLNGQSINTVEPL